MKAKDEAASVRKAELAQEKKVQEDNAEAEERKSRVHKPGKSVEETKSFLHKPVSREDLSVYPSYYTLYTPFIHLHYHTYTYVHPLYMYIHHINISNHL